MFATGPVVLSRPRSPLELVESVASQNRVAFRGAHLSIGWETSLGRSYLLRLLERLQSRESSRLFAQRNGFITSLSLAIQSLKFIAVRCNHIKSNCNSAKGMSQERKKRTCERRKSGEI